MMKEELCDCKFIGVIRCEKAHGGWSMLVAGQLSRGGGSRQIRRAVRVMVVTPAENP